MHFRFFSNIQPIRVVVGLRLTLTRAPLPTRRWRTSRERIDLGMTVPGLILAIASQQPPLSGFAANALEKLRLISVSNVHRSAGDAACAAEPSTAIAPAVSALASNIAANLCDVFIVLPVLLKVLQSPLLRYSFDRGSNGFNT